MQLSFFPKDKSQTALDGFVYPLSLEELNRQLGDILSSSRCHVEFLSYENTSDLLIVRSFWDEAIDLWSMTIVAVREDELKSVQKLLATTGIWETKRWFLLAHEKLHRHQDEWLIESLTMRYEQNQLIMDARESQRPGKRPPPRTSPQGGYWKQFS